MKTNEPQAIREIIRSPIFFPVRFPVPDLAREFATFPYEIHYDFVDAMTYAVSVIKGFQKMARKYTVGSDEWIEQQRPELCLSDDGKTVKVITSQRRVFYCVRPQIVRSVLSSMVRRNLLSHHDASVWQEILVARVLAAGDSRPSPGCVALELSWDQYLMEWNDRSWDVMHKFRDLDIRQPFSMNDILLHFQLAARKLNIAIRKYDDAVDGVRGPAHPLSVADKDRERMTSQFLITLIHGIHKDDKSGYMDENGHRCPRCRSKTLINRDGKRWCSFVGGAGESACSWGVDGGDDV